MTMNEAQYVLHPYLRLRLEDLLHRLIFLRKIRNKHMKKAYLSFDGVNARLTCGDTTVPIAAQGHWPGTACMDGRFLLRLTTTIARGFPSKDLVVYGRQDEIEIGNMRLKCVWCPNESVGTGK